MAYLQNLTWKHLEYIVVWITSTFIQGFVVICVGDAEIFKVLFVLSAYKCAMNMCFCRQLISNNMCWKQILSSYCLLPWLI